MASASPSPRSQAQFTATNMPPTNTSNAAPSAASIPKVEVSLPPDSSVPERSLDGPATAAPSRPAADTFVPAWRRPTLGGDGTGAGARRQSVQFVPHATRVGSRSSSANTTPTGRSKSSAVAQASGRRLSSPPPPAQFRPSVGFDTFNNPAASDFSLTLNRKHRDYEYTKRSRTFLCGTDTNDYSDTALEWLIDELVDDGDEVVCLRVVEKDSKEAAKWSDGKGERGYREEAQRFLSAIEKKNTDDKAISLVLEFSVGKVPDTIQRMITIYQPVILVVGTRGRSLTGYQGLINSGSVSKHCLQYSPVPVIVVRPSRKREAKKQKRLQDPTRSGYRDILDKSEDAPRGRGGHLLDATNKSTIIGSELGALGELHGDQDGEARRVAEAIGWPASHQLPPASDTYARGNSLTRTRSDASRRSDDGKDGYMQSPQLGRLLKSPELRNLDSPPASDDEGDDALDDEYLGQPQEPIRPEDEAAMLAYERAQQLVKEEAEEAEVRAKRSASRGRNGSRPRRANDEDEPSGAAVLDIFEKLNRGIR